MPQSARRARGRLFLQVFGAIILGPVVWVLALLALPRPTALARLQAGSGDVSLSKTVAQTSVGPGGALTYTLAVTASAAPATEIRLTDTLPSGLTWITDTAEAAGLSRLSTSPPVWTAGPFPLPSSFPRKARCKRHSRQPASSTRSAACRPGGRR